MPPPHTTHDFESLLSRTNVIGVNYAPDRDHLDVWVSQKLPREQLATADDVTHRDNLPDDFDGSVDVHDAGYDDERDGFDPAIARPGDAGHAGPEQASPGRRSRVRPVESGISELAGPGAATGGTLARVTRPGAGDWVTRVEAGDLVRVSNHHVYVEPYNADFGVIPHVRQPSKLDGGQTDDIVGTTVGYVPLADGVHVDAAARDVDITQESAHHYDMDGLGTGVVREDYQSLVGGQLVKGGRTTGRTAGKLRAADATIRVGYGDPIGVVKLRHQLVAADMSKGGDSGSPVFVSGTDGRLIGHLFAGSDNATIINKAERIEHTLGVELMPSETDSLDADGTVEMTQPKLTWAGADPQSKPGPGETVRLRVSAESNYRQTVWLEVSGPVDSQRVEVAPDDLQEQDDGSWLAFTSVTLTAPDEYVEGGFTYTVDGGHVLG